MIKKNLETLLFNICLRLTVRIVSLLRLKFSPFYWRSEKKTICIELISTMNASPVINT